MPGDAANEIQWFGSTNTGPGPFDFNLGGARDATPLQTQDLTVATAGAPGEGFLDLSAAVTSSIPGSWLYIRNGVAGGFTSEILRVEGTVAILADDLLAIPSIGDDVQIFSIDATLNPWGSLSALDSALGYTRYQTVYLKRSVGSATNAGFYIENLDPGPATHQIGAGFYPTGLWTPATTATAETVPNLKESGNPFFRSVNGGPIFTKPTIDSSGAVGIWLKRISPPNTLAFDRTRAIALVMIDTDNGDFSKLIIPWNTAGLTPVFTHRASPSLYLRGSTRFNVVVTALESGLPLPGAPVQMTKISGPGTLRRTDGLVTDARGKAFAELEAPTDVGQVGQVVTVDAEV